tara:strand:+ start:8041 stop:12105 length:4065 start_codon:yes stop_codon:yes gene_type:complete
MYSNPTNEILNGKPDLEDDGVNSFEEPAKVLDQYITPEESSEVESPSEGEQTSKEVSSDTQQTTEQPKEEKPQGNLFEWPDWLDPNNAPLDLEIEASALAGVADTAIGGVNWIADKFGIPKIPTLTRYQEQELQAIRDISAQVLPTMALGGALSWAGKGLQGLNVANKTNKISRVLAKLGNDSAVKFISNAGITTGSGLMVDTVAPSLELDHNSLGALKDTWPETYSFIPDSWATLESDTPEVKREKNKREAAVLGFGLDLFASAAKLRIAKKSIPFYVPENEMAKAAAERLNKTLDDIKTPEDVLLHEAAKREQALDLLGEYNLKKAKEEGITEPLLGYHDSFTATESGLRTVDDGGIVSASVDLLKTTKNIDSYNGRVASVLPDAVLKEALGYPKGVRKVVLEEADKLRNAGRYGVNTSQGYKPFSEIEAAAEPITADLLRMSVDEMKEYFKPIRNADGSVSSKSLTYTDDNNATGALLLRDEPGAYVASVKALNQYIGEFASWDEAKAVTYLSTSLGGQISDMAWTARQMTGSDALEHIHEMIIDRMSFLMTMIGQTRYVAGRTLNLKNIFKRLSKGDASFLKGAKHERNETLKGLQRIQDETKNSMQTLRNINKERPELLGPFMLAHEISDGDITTITKMNEMYKHLTRTASSAVVDLNPDMPSLINQGIWGNIYNSTFSLGTPLAAGIENAVTLIEKPVALLAGAAAHLPSSSIRGTSEAPVKAIRRGWVQYTKLQDTMDKAARHMSKVFKMASTDPSSVEYIMRDDISRMSEDRMAFVRSFANAQEEIGEYGASHVADVIETLRGLETHPVLRVAANGLTASDGFSRAALANLEAYAHAYDEINISGGKLNPDMLETIADQAYKKMFNKKGFLKNDQIEFQARELTMQTNNVAIRAVNPVLSVVPALRIGSMFPRTGFSILQYFGSHSPVGLFVETFNKFPKPFHEMPFEKVKKLLEERGIKPTQHIEAQYNEIYYELKGRKVIGGLLTGLGLTAAMHDRCRGYGHYDKGVQKTRTDNNWKPLTCKNPFGGYTSYNGYGPITDFIALTTTIYDNADLLEEHTLQNLTEKLQYVVSAAIINKTTLRDMAGMIDALTGNVAELTKLGTEFSNKFVPLSGDRKRFAEIMDNGIKNVKQEFDDILAKRNPGLRETLPDAYNYMTGKKKTKGPAGTKPLDWLGRVIHAYTGFRSFDAPTEHQQYLIDIEYDGRAIVSTDVNGIEYPKDMQSAIFKKMGELGTWDEAVEEMMKAISADELRATYRREQKENVAPQDKNAMLAVTYRLDKHLRAAVDEAEYALYGDNNPLLQQAYDEKTEKVRQQGQYVKGSSMYTLDKIREEKKRKELKKGIRK